MKKQTALVIGAGIAGISFAYELVTKSDIKPIIIEEESLIGGLAKTLNYDNNLADIGPHRFFSKNEDVLNFWSNILPTQGEKALDDILLNRKTNYNDGTANPEEDDNVFLQRRRFSRIYYLKKFFDYPVKLNFTTIKNLGLIRTVKCGFSYLYSCLFKRKEYNLEDFMINRFGKELYKTFFEFYTEKVWGRKPKNIDKSWGEQRIKGISILKVLLSKYSKQKETSLIENYFYPKLGASQLLNEMLKIILEKGGELHLNSKVVKINHDENRINSLTVKKGNEELTFEGEYIVSSMPIKILISEMNNVDKKIQTTANELPYRDYQLITYLVDDFNLKNNTKYKTINDICPDSWIYIQDRDVKIGRIYIPKNFSPYLCENINDTLVCLEYFCDKNDELWNMTDEEIYEFGINELIKIKALKNKNNVLKKYRLKVEKAYPAYFDSYKDFDTIKDFLNKFDNLYCIGRNGQHKYNNMDHSTLSGIVAAKMIMTQDKNKNKLWNINTEQSYQETK